MMRLSLFLVALVFAALPARAQDATAFQAPPAQAGATASLSLAARLVEDGPAIERGLVWRVFGEEPDANGKLPLIASSEGGSATLSLPTGSYFVHAAFGRAGASKRVAIDRTGRAETFVLKAGGLELNATSGGKALPPRSLRFAIYELEQDEEGNRNLIALNVEAGKVVALNAGTYHILSRYGTINATVRADLEVKAGQLTKATLEHRGAAVAMRLVSAPGGDPLANTSWTVFTQDGEKVFSSKSVAPGLVLAEGTYEAAVRYGAQDFRQNFDVVPGKPIKVEIVLQ